MKNCKICGENFTPKNGRGCRQYCGPVCAREGHKQRNVAYRARKKAGMPSIKHTAKDSITQCWAHWLLKYAAHVINAGRRDGISDGYAVKAAECYLKNKT